MAAKGQQQWNRGLVGESAPPRHVERPGDCTSDRCGTQASVPGRAPAGMKRVRVPGSREPARLYCAGFCALYGEALAELRSQEGAAS